MNVITTCKKKKNRTNSQQSLPPEKLKLQTIIDHCATPKKGINPSKTQALAC